MEYLDLPDVIVMHVSMCIPRCGRGILTKNLFSVKILSIFTLFPNIFNVRPPQTPTNYERLLPEPLGVPRAIPQGCTFIYA